MKKNKDKPFVILGDKFTDERGNVVFVNNFRFDDVKRFYVVSNKNLGQFRGWHGHKREAKYIFVVSGIATIGAVKIDNWEKPSRELKVAKFNLSFDKPKVLYIPKGFANGFRNLTKDAKIIFFSTSDLSDSKKDDIRFPQDYWKL